MLKIWHVAIVTILLVGFAVVAPVIAQAAAAIQGAGT
jgi:hypothetical protein